MLQAIAQDGLPDVAELDNVAHMHGIYARNLVEIVFDGSVHGWVDGADGHRGVDRAGHLALLLAEKRSEGREGIEDAHAEYSSCGNWVIWRRHAYR
jgi:hypothetical protein